MSYRPIFFDTETTGTYPNRDKIVEIAAYDPVRNKTFEALVHPGMSIPKEVIAIHKITDEMVADAPSFQEVAKRFLEFCDGDVALIAHNLDTFDLPFLQNEMKRADVKLPVNWLYIDSLKWARRYRKDLPRHALQYLRQVYGIAENQAHRALNDVMVLHDVYNFMVGDLSPEQVHRLLYRGATETVQVKEEVATAPTKEAALSLF